MERNNVIKKKKEGEELKRKNMEGRLPGNYQREFRSGNRIAQFWQMQYNSAHVHKCLTARMK